jgi:hypothetical protein
MTLESPAAAPTLTESLHTKLHSASAPLKFSEVARGLTKPRKIKAADFQEEIRSALAEEVRLGRVFSYPSGKGAESRYWGRDEKQVLRDKALELAATPGPLSTLKIKLGKELKGTDAAFIDSVVQELIRDNQLFEHPPKSSKGVVLIGATAPPPPLPVLERARFKKTVDRLALESRKLLHAAGAQAEDLFEALRVRFRNLGPLETAPKPPPAAPAEAATSPEQADERPAHDARPSQSVAEPPALAGSGLEDLILKAVENTPVVSLADLRREMPREFQGREFDETVLRLADEQRVVLGQEPDPSHLTDAERAGFVQEGAALFATVARRRQASTTPSSNPTHQTW